MERPGRIVGQVIRETFESIAPTTLLLTTFRNKTTPANPPTLQLQKRSSGAVVTDGVTVTINRNSVTGSHLLEWDTNQGTPDGNEDYDLICTDGEIDSGDGSTFIDMTNRKILGIPLLNDAGGYVYDRAVKVLAGTVVSATSLNAVVSVANVDHTGQPNDHYQNMRLTYQSGNQKGISRNIFRSVPSGTNIDLIFTRPLVGALPQVNDTVKIIPEEQPGPAAIAHATIDFVLPQNTYGCVWTFDNRVATPDNNTVTLDAWNMDTSTQIITAQSMSAAGGDSYRYETAATVPAGQQVYALFTALINGRTYQWPHIRTNLVTVQGT